MSIPKFVYMTKNTPFFPILHVFAPLNDVRAYTARSWKTTLIMWLFEQAWYPLDIRVAPLGKPSPYFEEWTGDAEPHPSPPLTPTITFNKSAAVIETYCYNIILGPRDTCIQVWIWYSFIKTSKKGTFWKRPMYAMYLLQQKIMENNMFLITLTGNTRLGLGKQVCQSSFKYLFQGEIVLSTLSKMIAWVYFWARSNTWLRVNFKGLCDEYHIHFVYK